MLHLLGTAGDGGAETYFVDLLAALERAGEPQAAAIRPNARREAALAAAGVETGLFRFGGLLDLTTRSKLAGFAKSREAGVMVAWMNRAARHAPRGPWARIGRLGGYYNLKYYKNFDFLVANTEDIAEWVVDRGWPPGKVRYIPNFAEAAQAVQPAPRASLATPEGVPLLLALGRLHEAKAHDVALEAMTRLPDAWLWIAGSGPQETRLKALADALGVADRVRFLGWRDDASALYRAADACLFPSRYEPLGNVVIQCWAHGLPVAAAASKGPAALIRDGEDGLLVPIDDAQALAEAARRLLDDAGLRARLAGGGAARVARDFSEAAVVAEWRTLFAEFGGR